MGYMLSSLGNLPIQDDISLYIFVVNGRWKGGLNDVIEKNFGALAKQIGPNSKAEDRRADKDFGIGSWDKTMLDEIKYLTANIPTAIIHLENWLQQDAPTQL